MNSNRPTWQLVGSPRRTRRRGFLASILVLGGASVALGCGPPPAKAPNPTRALDERRAIEVIIRGFRAEGDRPIRGREVELESGVKIKIDVGAAEKLYGVAYITDNDRRAMGAGLPQRDASMGDALQLVRGMGDNRDARILILHDTSYTYDDQVGTTHESTTITAENMLARDVRDFVLRAHSDRWP